MLAFQAGDDAAFDRLVSRYQPSVCRFLWRTIRDDGRAEDLAQEVFLRVYRSRRRYAPTAGFRTWLFTIASRLALNELRSLRRRRRVIREAPARDSAGGGEGTGDFWASVASPALESPHETAQRHELERVLDELIAELPENQRLAIELHRGGSHSYLGIAETLGVSLLAVKSLLVRARWQLKLGLDRHFEDAGREKGART